LIPIFYILKSGVNENNLNKNNLGLSQTTIQNFTFYPLEIKGNNYLKNGKC
tara:strand:+ start:502 stop:654 length:153 start_codon:yes stop_codon:yes gene_type:complete